MATARGHGRGGHNALIAFTAEDGQGETCSGSVDVGIRVKGQTPAGNPTIEATTKS